MQGNRHEYDIWHKPIYYSGTTENGDRTKTVVSMCIGLVILLLLKWLLESMGPHLQPPAVSCHPQSNICASVCG